MQKLQEQDERAELLKDRLRWEQQELRMRLQQLQGGTERMRNDSLGSAMSSERSDSDRGDCPVYGQVASTCGSGYIVLEVVQTAECDWLKSTLAVLLCLITA